MQKSKEGFERGIAYNVGEDRIREEQELQQGWDCQLDKCLGGALVGVAQPSHTDEHNDDSKDRRQHHVDKQRCKVAAEVEALEQAAEVAHPKAHTDREGVENSPHRVRQLDLVHSVDFGGNQVKGKQSKEVKERQDMVIFSILLFISRLVPAFQLVDRQNLVDDEEEKEDNQEM